MRHLDSRWRMSIGWCLFVFVEAYCVAAMNWWAGEKEKRER